MGGATGVQCKEVSASVQRDESGHTKGRGCCKGGEGRGVRGKRERTEWFFLFRLKGMRKGEKRKGKGYRRDGGAKHDGSPDH